MGDRPQDQIGALLLDTARAWRTRLNQLLKPLGLSQSQWLVLVHLARQDGMVQKDLAEHMGIEAPTLVGILNRMERDGWINRQDCPQDKRSKRIHLTRQSRKILDSITVTAQALRAEIFKGIPTADIASAVVTLQKIRDRLEQAP